MTKSSTNRSLVLIFENQQICVQLQASEVVFHIPNVDGSILEFQIKRRSLHKLKSKLSCKDDHVQVSLTAEEGNEFVLDCLSPKTANQYRQDIDAAKQLLAKPYWSRAAAKTFSLGAMFGVLAVVASAFWLVSNNLPMTSVSQADVDWQSRVEQALPTRFNEVEESSTDKESSTDEESSTAEEWQP